MPHECFRNHLALERFVQELEFIIHADGRVEERVRGIKGVDCQSVTAEINKALGEVIQSKPTQEMFEQKVTALNPAPSHMPASSNRDCSTPAGRAVGRRRKHGIRDLGQWREQRLPQGVVN